MGALTGYRVLDLSRVLAGPCVASYWLTWERKSLKSNGLEWVMTPAGGAPPT